MAGTGLAIPIAARYTDDGFGNVRYTGGKRFAKAIEFTTEFGDKKSNNLYADNSVAETQNMFSGGTVSLKVDDLDVEAIKLIFGLEEQKYPYNGKNASIVVNKANDSSPYLGLGLVVEKQRNGILSYVAIILPKTSFPSMADIAKTKGESVEWQTPSLTGTIMRDDTPEHSWRIRGEFPTEAGAMEFIKYFLGMTPSALTVTSVAGTAANMTAITAAPVKAAGHSYKYLLGSDVYVPDKDAIIPDTYNNWDGTAEIEIAGKKYPMNFSMKAAKAFAGRYGNVEDVWRKLDGISGLGKIDEFTWILRLLIEQGCAYKKLVDDEHIVAPTVDELEILMGFIDVTTMYDIIEKTIFCGMTPEVEVELKKKVEEIEKASLLQASHGVIITADESD